MTTALEVQKSKASMQRDFNDAISFAISMGLAAADFLELWQQGVWDAIRIEFPEYVIPPTLEKPWEQPPV